MEFMSQPAHFWDRLESEHSPDIAQKVAAHAEKLPAELSDDHVVLVLEQIRQAVMSGNADRIVPDLVTGMPRTRFSRDARENLDDGECEAYQSVDWIAQDRATVEVHALRGERQQLHSATPTVIAAGAFATVQTCPDDSQAVEKCFTCVKASNPKRQALVRELSICFCRKDLRHRNVMHARAGCRTTPSSNPRNVEPDDFRMRMARFDGSLASRHGLTDTHGRRIAPLTPREAKAIAYQLLQGLRHMHDVQCVAHGDIKLANILLKLRGGTTRAVHVAVADFGCAHNVDADAFMGGTPAYCGNGTGWQKDAWAVGLVIGQLLAGDVEEAEATKASFYAQVLQNVIRGWMKGTVEEEGLLLVLSLLDLCPEKRPCMTKAMFSSFFDDELRAEFAEEPAVPPEAIPVEENVCNKKKFYQALFASSSLVTAGDADVP